MPEWLSETQIVALIGVVTGIPLGLAARLGRFCTLGAIEDYLYGDDDRRLRMWGIAIGVAVIGSFTLISAGLLDPLQTIYLEFRLNILATVIGGLVFGYGMAIAGNCGYGALSRLGGGDLRNFVLVLVMGISAWATISGPLAFVRDAMFPQLPRFDAAPNGIAHDIATLSGVSVTAVGLMIGLAILWVSLASPAIRNAPATCIWGTVVGLSAVFAWAGTQFVASTGFAGLPVTAHSFAAPLGESIAWTMSASGRPLSFAVGSVFGVWLGAFIGSLIKGHFRWEACEDPRELRRQIVGAGMMGIGAVLAMGCSVGQGISGISVLAWSAPIMLVSLFAGAALGLRHLISGFPLIGHKVF